LKYSLEVLSFYYHSS